MWCWPRWGSGWRSRGWVGWGSLTSPFGPAGSIWCGRAALRDQAVVYCLKYQRPVPAQRLSVWAKCGHPESKPKKDTIETQEFVLETTDMALIQGSYLSVRFCSKLTWCISFPSNLEILHFSTFTSSTDSHGLRYMRFRLQAENSNLSGGVFRAASTLRTRYSCSSRYWLLFKKGSRRGSNVPRFCSVRYWTLPATSEAS